jgi:hypothetical protein
MMRRRPFGAGRKQRRSAARYTQTPSVKSEVVVTTVAERDTQPPRNIRRRRMFLPNPLQVDSETTATNEIVALATIGVLDPCQEFTQPGTAEPEFQADSATERRDAAPTRFRQRRGIRRSRTQPRRFDLGNAAAIAAGCEGNQSYPVPVTEPPSTEPTKPDQVTPPSPVHLAQLLNRRGRAAPTVVEQTNRAAH